MKKQQYRFFLSAVAISVLSATCATATAQESAEQKEDLEIIMVTSSKTNKPLQKVPAAISVVDGERLAQAARVSADDVLANVAGVEVQGAARGKVFAIRGLGSDLPPGVGESSVSTNYDEVYSIRAEAGQLGFYDLERVEVMRGPQGTLYGRNATAGVINFISHSPVLGEFGGHVGVSAGDYNFRRGEGAVNIPVSEDFAVRVAGTIVKRDGFLSNGHNDLEGDGQRIKALYQPSDDFSLLLGYDRIHLDGMGAGATESAYWESGDYYTTDDSGIGDGQDYTSDKYYAKLQWNVGPGQLTILPSYQTGDGTNEAIFAGRGTAGYDPKNVEQNALEVRYGSLPGEDIEWIVGFFHYDYEQSLVAEELYADGTTSGVEDSSFTSGDSDALFGQVTFPVAEDWRITAGARYTWDERESEGTAPAPIYGYAGTRDDNFFDWKLGLEHDLSDNALVYVQAATGFRPGGVNPFDGNTIIPEELLSYEAGIKSRLWDGALQLNASSFYYDYSDFQIVDFFITATGPNLSFYNADAVNWGAELEMLAIPSDAHRINFSLAYLNSEIESDLCLNPSGYTGAADAECDGLGANAINFKGERLPHSPDLTIKAGYEYIYEGNGGWLLIPRIEMRYVTEQYVAPSNQDIALQGDYFTGDITVTWHDAQDKLSVSGYVKNFTDEAVKTGFFTGYVVGGAPRTTGVSLNYRF